MKSIFHRQAVSSQLCAWTIALFGLLAAASSLAQAENRARAGKEQLSTAKQPISLRRFAPKIDERWIGQGISYGPYREGQRPGGVGPTKEQLSEDLHLLAKHWNLLRMYGAGEVAEEVLQVIRDEKIPMRVMLGAWITNETPSDNLDDATAAVAKQANESQTAEAIRLANSYPEVVVAVSVGNETQVYWSDHITKPEVLIGYIRKVRNATSVPITTADDFNFWNKPESKAVVDEIDFIVLHIHALWGGTLHPVAMKWTEEIYDDISARHPNRKVVIGEAGWATQVHNEGEQAKLIKGEATEEAQRYYYNAFTQWAEEEQIYTFFFEAFDEPWKGGPHPNEVEKHWGLFNVDRTPKAAMNQE